MLNSESWCSPPAALRNLEPFCLNREKVSDVYYKAVRSSGLEGTLSREGDADDDN